MSWFYIKQVAPALESCLMSSLKHEELRSSYTPSAGVFCSLSLRVLLIKMMVLPWQPESLNELVAEISVELQPLPFLLPQQETVDVGEELMWRRGDDEALSVYAELVQQHHAEVGSGDSVCLPMDRNNTGNKEQSPVSWNQIVVAEGEKKEDTLA